MKKLNLCYHEIGWLLAVYLGFSITEIEVIEAENTRVFEKSASLLTKYYNENGSGSISNDEMKEEIENLEKLIDPGSHLGNIESIYDINDINDVIINKNNNNGKNAVDFCIFIIKHFKDNDWKILFKPFINTDIDVIITDHNNNIHKIILKCIDESLYNLKQQNLSLKDIIIKQLKLKGKL